MKKDTSGPVGPNLGNCCILHSWTNDISLETIRWLGSFIFCISRDPTCPEDTSPSPSPLPGVVARFVGLASPICRPHRTRHTLVRSVGVEAFLAGLGCSSPSRTGIRRPSPPLESRKPSNGTVQSPSNEVAKPTYRVPLPLPRCPAMRLSIAPSLGTSNAVRVADPCHFGREDLSATPKVSILSAPSLTRIMSSPATLNCLTMCANLSLAVWICKARLLTVCAEKDGVWPADLLRETRTSYSSSIPRVSGRIRELCLASRDR